MDQYEKQEIAYRIWEEMQENKGDLIEALLTLREKTGYPVMDLMDVYQDEQEGNK